jgi:hypothetical protein
MAWPHKYPTLLKLHIVLLEIELNILKGFERTELVNAGISRFLERIKWRILRDLRRAKGWSRTFRFSLGVTLL